MVFHKMFVDLLMVFSSCTVQVEADKPCTTCMACLVSPWCKSRALCIRWDYVETNIINTSYNDIMILSCCCSSLLLDHHCLLLFSTCLQRPTSKCSLLNIFAGPVARREAFSGAKEKHDKVNKFIYKSYILQEGTRVTPQQKKTQLLHSFESCFLQETTSFRSEHKYAKRV